MTLEPAQNRVVVFRLSPSDLAYCNTTKASSLFAPGHYAVLVGTSSTERNNRAGFTVGRFGHAG